MFDSETFYRVIFLLFKGKPWKFFSKMKKYVGKDAYVDPGDLVV